MNHDTELTEAGRQYTAAYEIHYATKNLSEAFKRYKAIMTAHPGTKEAGYSESQIQNIVNVVVPKEERFGAQLDLAAAIFDQMAK